MFSVLRIVKKAEERFGAGSNLLDRFPASYIIQTVPVPNGNDMGPNLVVMLLQFMDATDCQVNFHRNGLISQ